MSQSTPDAPNEEPEAESTDAENELTFAEIKEVDNRLRSKRKTIHIAVPDPDDPDGDPQGTATFEYRMLTEEELDEAEDAAVSISTERNAQEVTTDSGALRATLIKYGVTSGPEGFKLNNERAARELPRYIKEPLANAIEDFTQMPEEAREGFR